MRIVNPDQVIALLALIASSISALVAFANSRRNTNEMMRDVARDRQRMDDKLDSLIATTRKTDASIDRLSEQVASHTVKFASIEGGLSSLRAKVDSIDGIDERVDRLDRRVSVIEERCRINCIGGTD